MQETPPLALSTRRLLYVTFRQNCMARQQRLMPEVQLHWIRILTRQTHVGRFTRPIMTLAHHFFAGDTASRAP